MSIINFSTEMPNIHIRSAVPADYDSVIQVLTQAWSKYAAKHSDISEALQNSLLGYLEPGLQERIVAESDGIIVGTAELFHSSEEAYGIVNNTIATPILRRLAVSPDWQGKGIATGLVQESARRAAIAGSDFLYLHTSSESNAPAVRLYEYLGFKRATEHDFYLGDYFMESFLLDLRLQEV